MKSIFYQYEGYVKLSSYVSSRHREVGYDLFGEVTYRACQVDIFVDKKKIILIFISSNFFQAKGKLFVQFNRFFKLMNFEKSAIKRFYKNHPFSIFFF